MNVNVREAEPCDADGLHRLVTELFKRGAPVQHLRETETTKFSMAASIRDPRTLWIVAMVDRVQVGYLAAQVSDGYAVIFTVRVGAGVASDPVMEALVSAARVRLAGRNLFLDVDTSGAAWFEAHELIRSPSIKFAPIRFPKGA